jgi:predicted nucleic acid-binding Zn ribbon protein
MPIYEYRCECGEVVEALVRGGREPEFGYDAGHYCDSGGKLIKLISAHNVGSSNGGVFRDSAGSSQGSSAPEASCGSCGRVPGSCQYD